MTGGTGKREGFTGKIGFILAAAGSAVGLGNLWRFPYLAEQYGGGAFLVIYVILVVTFGFTLMITEITLGRRTGKSCLTAFADLSKKHRWIGWLSAIVPILIVPYYCVIGGWVLKYMFAMATEGSTAFADASTSSEYFTSFITADFSHILDGPFIWFIIFAAVTLWVVSRGVTKGIERMSKVLMPALLILLVVLTVYCLIQPGSGPGIAHYLVPNMSDFTPETVLGAMAQLFYSMSLAMGIMIAYGSYMTKDTDIEKSARQISLIDTGVAILAGLMIVPAVITFSGGGEFAQGPGLMFQVLPVVFESMGAVGPYIGVAFFLLVFFAALTSSVSLAEAVIAMIMDRKKARRYAVGLVTVLILGLGLLSCFGYGPLETPWLIKGSFLDFFDFIANYVIMPVVAILTCLFIGYVVKPKFIIEEVESSGEFRFKKPYVYMVKYVAPIMLVLVLFSGLFMTI